MIGRLAKIVHVCEANFPAPVFERFTKQLTQCTSCARYQNCTHDLAGAGLVDELEPIYLNRFGKVIDTAGMYVTTIRANSNAR